MRAHLQLAADLWFRNDLWQCQQSHHRHDGARKRRELDHIVLVLWRVSLCAVVRLARSSIAALTLTATADTSALAAADFAFAAALALAAAALALAPATFALAATTLTLTATTLALAAATLALAAARGLSSLGVDARFADAHC